jgi:hypothetical protein
LYAAVVTRDAASPEELCRRVLEQVVLESGRAVVAATLAEAYGVELQNHETLRRVFVDRALRPQAGGEGEAESLFSVELSLRKPLVAIGAPVGIYYPGVAESIHARLCIPPHAEVANAVGAVVGSVTQRVHCLVVHLEEGIRDFENLEQACVFALERARGLALELADRAGASDIQVQVHRDDRRAIAGGDEFFLESRIEATAIGRPRLAKDRRQPRGANAARS